MPQNSLEPILRHLEKNAPSADKCVACAALMALFRTPGPLMLDNLDGICEKLLNIISSTDEADEVVKVCSLLFFSTKIQTITAPLFPLSHSFRHSLILPSVLS